MTSADKKKWVNIIFPHPPYQTFTYSVPEYLINEIKIGQRVLVPLGTRIFTGIIKNFTNKPDLKNIREIIDVIDSNPFLPEDIFKLTQWIAGYYLAPLGKVLKTALPPGVLQKSKIFVHRTESGDFDSSLITEKQRCILQILKKKPPVSLSYLRKEINSDSIRYDLKKLEQQGLINMEQKLEGSEVKIQYEKILYPAREISPQDIFDLKKKAPAQARVLGILMGNKQGITRKKIKVRNDTLKRLKEKGYIKYEISEKIRDPYKNVSIKYRKKITLTKEQNTALKTIKKHLDKQHFHPILLHGITSSGKTQVYLEAIKYILKKGETALVLIPEISLTPQAVQRYRAFFGDQVAVLHSRMSKGERFDTWRKIKDGTYKITIGPRSALFAPLHNLGIIIVDEEHDASYKQKDPAPRYHARDSAIVRASLNNCVIILGSATPSLESYHNAQNGKYTLCTLTQRIDDLPLPRVTLIDHTNSIMEKETRIFCTKMKENIQKRLENGDQIILLQNRRGYSTFLRCSSCGFIDSCPNCDISLTYHQRDHFLLCHTCGFRKKAADSCSSCGGTTISYRGIGTQRIEEELKKCFPESKITRMDQDTTRRKGTHDKIITDFENKKNDILFGTQMIAKGHDFPGVNLVGIISADTGLYFPDFRSAEKTFQLLTQAAGRAGRKGIPGEVIIQTMNPEHPVLRFAIDHDYEKFFYYETAQRRELQYPPWGRIIIVRFRFRKKEMAAKAAQSFTQLIKKNTAVTALGPAICPISRIKNYYRFQILFRTSKAKDPSGRILRKAVREALDRYLYRKEFPNVKVSIDVDPMDVM